MIELYFGTNRNPTRARNPEDYGSGLNDRGTSLRFGKAWITNDLSRVDQDV